MTAKLERPVDGSPSQPPTPPRRTRRKILAILAGGLVLGVGAAVTLAAWNDSEFATGTFTAGSFNLQGSTDGTTFTDHPAAASAAALTFSTGFNLLSPNDVVAAPFAVRLDAATTNNATAVFTSAATTGTATANLTYGVVQVASIAACTPAATGSATLVPAGTGMNAVTGATTFNLAKGTGGAAGATVFLCFQVKAGAAIAPLSTATSTWGLTATSQ